MSLYAGIELPDRPDPANIQRLDLLCVPMIRRMHRFGIRVDRGHFAELSLRLSQHMAELRHEIVDVIPPAVLDAIASADDDDADVETESFNVESSARVARLLYDHLRLDRTAGVKIKKTKGGERLSTGKKMLEQLKREHPVVPLILEYREASKLDSTYARTMSRKARWHPAGLDCPECGSRHYSDEWRVHTQILTTRTATGRLASKWPNLQNIPARSELGREIRAGFIASDGWVIVQRDFAQIELRLAADRSGDADMIRIYATGGDIHQDTAMRAFDLPADKVDKLAHRAPCKNVNFAVCIARDQRVLTDYGLVPIQDVACYHKVWDGIEFVSHSGVVSRGRKRVISYEGLTATPDHKVWLEDGTVATLSEARMLRRRLGIGAHSETPVGFAHVGFDGDTYSRNIRKSRIHELHALQPDTRGYGEQHRAWENYQLSVQTAQVARSQVQAVAGTICGNGAAVSESEERLIQELWWPGHPGEIQIVERVCGICVQDDAASNVPQDRHRQDQQRWTLREGQYSTRNARAKSEKSTQQQNGQVSWKGDHCNGVRRASEARLSRFQADICTYDETSVRGSSVAGGTAEESTWSVQEVFDIVNAGPRRRFTCEGKIVSNCYGITDEGLLDLMADTYSKSGSKLPDWMTKRWCNEFIGKWFSLYPGIRRYLDAEEQKARRHGIVWTALGRVRRIPEVHSVHDYVQEAGIRQGANHGIQGFSADLMRLAMGETEDRLVQLQDYGIPSRPLLSIHDELLVEMREDEAYTGEALLGEVMGNVLVDRQSGRNLCRVPIESDGKLMKRWVKE